MIEIYKIICLFLACRAFAHSDPRRTRMCLASRKTDTMELEGIPQEPGVQSVISASKPVILNNVVFFSGPKFKDYPLLSQSKDKPVPIPLTSFVPRRSCFRPSSNILFHTPPASTEPQKQTNPYFQHRTRMEMKLLTWKLSLSGESVCLPSQGASCVNALITVLSKDNVNFGRVQKGSYT